jgi:hypothetical protein
LQNLEKLRSFASLLRCIKTLVSDDSFLKVFKRACLYAGFVGTFITCDSIDKFIEHLRTIINENKPNVSQDIIQRTLIKLEIEFLKKLAH